VKGKNDEYEITIRHWDGHGRIALNRAINGGDHPTLPIGVAAVNWYAWTSLLKTNRGRDDFAKPGTATFIETQRYFKHGVCDAMSLEDAVIELERITDLFRVADKELKKIHALYIGEQDPAGVAIRSRDLPKLCNKASKPL